MYTNTLSLSSARKEEHVIMLAQAHEHMHTHTHTPFVLSSTRKSSTSRSKHSFGVSSTTSPKTWPLLDSLPVYRNLNLHTLRRTASSHSHTVTVTVYLFIYITICMRETNPSPPVHTLACASYMHVCMSCLVRVICMCVCHAWCESYAHVYVMLGASHMHVCLRGMGSSQPLCTSAGCELYACANMYSFLYARDKSFAASSYFGLVQMMVYM